MLHRCHLTASSPYAAVATAAEEADAYVAALSQDRDDAWERAARLTVLAKEMEAEAAGLREVVSALAPQTYETLGSRAQYLFAAGRRGVRRAA